MKKGRNLTLAQKKYLQSLKMDPANWLIVKKQDDFWLLKHRYLNQTKEVLAP